MQRYSVSGYSPSHKKRRKCHFYGLLTRLRPDRRHRSGSWARRAAATRGNPPPIHPNGSGGPCLNLLATETPTSPASETPDPGEKNLRQGLEFAQKLLPLLMESHPSGDPLQRGKRTTQNRTPNPSFTFFREYRTSEMKRQTRFCRLFTVCLFVVSVNVVTNRKLTSYNAFLHRQVKALSAQKQTRHSGGAPCFWKMHYRSVSSTC